LGEVGYPVDAFRFWYFPGPWGRDGQSGRLYHRLRHTDLGDAAAGTPDLLLSYWAYPDADAAGRLAAARRIPSAVIVGGSDLLVQARDPAHRRRVLGAIARHQRVFAVGEPLRDALVNAGVAEARIRLLERGVDRRHFHPGDRTASRVAVGLPTDRPIVVWAGRFETVKDLPTLVRAVATLPPPARPLLARIGAGSQTTSVARLAAQLGVELVRPGPLAPRDLGQWYRAADLVALSSLSEGTPNVLLEAAASGTAIVTTDAGGAGALARRLGAPVVPIGDHRALGQAIAESLAQGPPPPDTAALIPTLEAASARLSDHLREVLDHGD
jgi:glycosyltransferase involved in cell wall biosynthesis